MSIERWLPINFEFHNKIKVQKTVFAGDEWQLYNAKKGMRILVAKSNLVQKWISKKLLDESMFGRCQFGEEQYYYLESGDKQRLTPVMEFDSPESKTDAYAFAVSIRETRKIIPDTSLHDAIFVERFSRLLPTWTISETMNDEQLLGSWLTGGVNISTSSFRRISNLLGWLNKSDIRDVIQSAGLEVPDDVAATKTKSRTHQQPKNNQKQSTEKSKKLTNKNKSSSRRNDGEFKLSGRPFLEKFFNEHVIDIIQNEEQYKLMGIDFPSAVVLHGPPGCGKTFAVDQLVEFLDWPVYNIDSNSIGSPYIHETSRKVSEIFETAMENSPAIVVIDEMESFLSDRQMGHSSGMHRVEEVAEFLRRIPEAITNRVLIVAMTNRLEMIDPAILRRGRFDHVIEVGMPSKEEVTELVKTLLNKMPVSGKLITKEAIEFLTGRPLSDAAFTIREAGRLAAKIGKNKLDQDSLDAAIASLPNISEEEKSRSIGFIRGDT